MHGDLRKADLFVTTNNDVAIIDFDWAGLDGTARYPLWMNPSIEWPSGSKPGGLILITKEHDKFWL